MKWEFFCILKLNKALLNKHVEMWILFFRLIVCIRANEPMIQSLQRVKWKRTDIAGESRIKKDKKLKIKGKDCKNDEKKLKEHEKGRKQ
jgi:hypothetical protein